MAKIGSRDEFVAWLEQRRQQIIGKTRSHECCPIAKWLKDINPGLWVRVGGFVAYIGNEFLNLPEWASEFITAFDQSGISGMAMTGNDALWTLEKLEEA